jgi:hypothetical protein
VRYLYSKKICFETSGVVFVAVMQGWYKDGRMCTSTASSRCNVRDKGRGKKRSEDGKSSSWFFLQGHAGCLDVQCVVFVYQSGAIVFRKEQFKALGG